MGVTLSRGLDLKTFPLGGIHPIDCKIAAKEPTFNLSLPQQAIFLLSQHIGVPSKPVVAKGDRVKVGQLIAEASGFVSANIHSSVSGVVEKIDDVIDVTGYKKPAIYIKVEGDEWMPQIDRSTDLKKEIIVSPVEIVEKVRALGIVGLGGAAFPTHVKLTVGKVKPEYLLINAVECEPYLTSDHRVMLERSAEIIIGVRIMMKALDVKKALIGIEVNKIDAIHLLSALAKQEKDIEVVPLKMRYPQGGERQLVKALINREIPPPPKGLPIDVGAVVVNVSTTVAIYDAIQKNKPLIDRIVTVTGRHVKRVGNFLVRIGTPMNDLIEAAGGLPDDATKVTAGGPMMGRAFSDLQSPMTKGLSGIVIYSGQDGFRGLVTNCIRCGKCVSVCPLGLEPYLVSALTEQGNYDRAEEEKILNCCDCGCCSYICPSHRPLVDYIKIGKAKVLEKMRMRKS